MSIRSKRAPLLRDLEANRTAVRGPRCDSLVRLLCGRRRVKAEPETSKPSEPPERRVRAFCPRQTGLVFLRPSGPADCAVRFKRALPPGTYAVSWHMVSVHGLRAGADSTSLHENRAILDDRARRNEG